ncbi:hypothetical protein BD779DRAFT_405196 [Infundibulicybe gibba]|nr:hypothetical protein BD779DRAFT_405196 [Infundibulicybe gibba]
MDPEKAKLKPDGVVLTSMEKSIDTSQHVHRTRNPFKVAVACFCLFFLGYKAIPKLGRPTGVAMQGHSVGHGSSDRPHKGMTTAEKEAMYLTIPSAESALAASRAYATHPHLAGSFEDLQDAEAILKVFQVPSCDTEIDIPSPFSKAISLG